VSVSFVPRPLYPWDKSPPYTNCVKFVRAFTTWWNRTCIYSAYENIFVTWVLPEPQLTSWFSVGNEGAVTLLNTWKLQILGVAGHHHGKGHTCTGLKFLVMKRLLTKMAAYSDVERSASVAPHTLLLPQELSTPSAYCDILSPYTHPRVSHKTKHQRVGKSDSWTAGRPPPLLISVVSKL